MLLDDFLLEFPDLRPIFETVLIASVVGLLVGFRTEVAVDSIEVESRSNSSGSTVRRFSEAGGLDIGGRFGPGTGAG